MHSKQKELIKAKDIFWHSKMRVLKICIGTFSRTPLLGKRGKKNAKLMQFKTEKVDLSGIPSALQDTSFLFMTDPHIGGNIDDIAPSVSEGIR